MLYKKSSGEQIFLCHNTEMWRENRTVLLQISSPSWNGGGFFILVGCSQVMFCDSNKNASRNIGEARCRSMKISSWCLSSVCLCFLGTSVIQVTATDADDPTYGNSARLVYSILQGQPYFAVEPQTGDAHIDVIFHNSIFHSIMGLR